MYAAWDYLCSSSTKQIFIMCVNVHTSCVNFILTNFDRVSILYLILYLGEANDVMEITKKHPNKSVHLLLSMHAVCMCIL